MNYLCKAQLTKSDLNRVRSEQAEIKEVIDGYKAGTRSKQEFIAARKRLADLAFLTRNAAVRLEKNRLRAV